MIVYDFKHGGLYDRDERTGQISKVLNVTMMEIIFLLIDLIMLII